MRVRTINEIGKRTNNEDFVLCRTLSNQSELFIVCDGVGGNAKGEVASHLAAASIGDYLAAQNEKKLTENDIEGAIKFTEQKLADFIDSNIESRGMATTLALVHIFSNSATIAHIGDSRVYFVRNGNIIFRTVDHKLVTDWVRSGYLTPEEAKVHPKRNQITRAIQGAHEPTFADFTSVSDLQIDDYFLICTDGILESIDEAFISSHFKAAANLDEITQTILKLCNEKSDDNYSAITIKI